MKRTLAIIFSVIILMSLVGCDKDDSEKSVKDSDSSVSKTESKAESSNEESKTESKTESVNEESKTEQINNKTEIPKTDIIFDNSYAFLGNSIVGDLESYDVADNADIYSYVGMTVATVFDQKSDGDKKTLLKEMLSKNYKTIFIMFGMNEIGWSYSDIFVEDYNELIDEIQAKLPDAKIYLLSITPITKAQEADKESDLKTNRIKEYNNLIKQIANNKNIGYLDVNSYLSNENGFLADDDSPDGYHLQPNCSLRLVDAIKYLISK